MDGSQFDWDTLIRLFLLAIGIAIILAVGLTVWVVLRIKKIHLPPDADPLTALRLTPLSVVILLDLLDFGLDFLSAPVAWVILGYLGLKPLRGVTVLESVIPGTQFLPTMTVAWIFARLSDPVRRQRP